MANSPRLVTVYDKDGQKYTVSHLNAHDMVRHLGYTYRPGREFSPVDPAPFDVKPVSRAAEKKHVQSVLDGVGTDFTGRAEAEEDEGEELPASFDAAAVDEVVEDTELPVTDPDAPKRRGRPSKA